MEDEEYERKIEQRIKELNVELANTQCPKKRKSIKQCIAQNKDRLKKKRAQKAQDEKNRFIDDILYPFLKAMPAQQKKIMANSLAVELAQNPNFNLKVDS